MKMPLLIRLGLRVAACDVDLGPRGVDLGVVGCRPTGEVGEVARQSQVVVVDCLSGPAGSASRLRRDSSAITVASWASGEGFSRDAAPSHQPPNCRQMLRIDELRLVVQRAEVWLGQVCRPGPTQCG